MKRIAMFSAFCSAISMVTVYGQGIKADKVPAAVKSALGKKYPEAKGVLWERENGNYEANWGGKSGEDNSALFTPSGEFVEILNAIPASQLPQAAVQYIRGPYNGVKISEAGKVTDAKGKITYEAEVKKKELVFDGNGNFVRK